MTASHERYRTRDLGGNYAKMGKALGGYAERIERPEEVAPALQRTRRATQAAAPRCWSSLHPQRLPTHGRVSKLQQPEKT